MISTNRRSDEENDRERSEGFRTSDVLVVGAGMAITGAVVYDVYRKNASERKRLERERAKATGT